MICSSESQEPIPDVGDVAASLSTYDLFQAQARLTPSAVAVTSPEGSRTYDQLDKAVTNLASRLVSSGVKPETYVALYLPRSLDMLVACLAIWKAGAAYVPLDLASPPARVQMALDQCLPTAILYASAQQKPPNFETSAQYIDVSCPLLQSEQPVCRPAEAPSAAYILFTSGSTGEPKGVVVGHAALSNLVRSVRDEIGFLASDRFAATSSLTFDIAALELFLPLIAGGSVHLLPEGVTRDAIRLRDSLSTSHATVVQGTPSMWRALLETGWRGDGMRAIAGGEVLDPDLARRLSARVNALWNGYGPTEATIYATLHKVTAHDLEDGAAIPIGAPLPNTILHVTDERGAPVGADIAGEILIGGQGLARGYLDRPDLDVERFITCPSLGGRFYRTGDIGYFRPDGTLMFLRRADAQIKFRGVRMEPGEIESRLLATPGISQAAAVVRTDDRGRKVLAAYLTPSRAIARPTDAQIRASLGDWLPDYMIPSTFLWMEALPLTASGKIDRSALPWPTKGPRAFSIGSEPEPLPQTIARLWGQVLGRAPLELDEDFFGAGGDSLAALNAVFLVASLAEHDLSVTDLIEHPTPSSFAAHLDSTRTHDHGRASQDHQIIDAALREISR